MKATKKILGASAALVLALGLATGSTFAWFSMNTTVQATGMNVTAKSDTVFLQIKSTDNSSSTFGKTADASMDVELLPVAHETFSSATDITNNTKWYYAYSDESDTADMVESTKTALTTESTFANYVACATYKVALTTDSGLDTVSDLKVSAITLPTDEFVNVIVVGANGYQEFTQSATTVSNATVLATSVGKQDVAEAEIKIYFYIDGNDDAVYTDNFDALTGAITVSFTASIPASSSEGD